MTARLSLDPESLRMVLDSAYEDLQRSWPRAEGEPARGAWVAFDEVAASVAWCYFPPEPDEPI